MDASIYYLKALLQKLNSLAAQCLLYLFTLLN